MQNRILLIRPPTVTKGTSFIATQFPLNIASIAGSLLEKGYKVQIWDFDVEPFEEEAFKERLKAFSPLVAGITCYTPTVINAHKIATVIKKHMPHIFTVVGGVHVSALPEQTLEEFENFDAGIAGEGEEAMLELADRLMRNDGIEDVRGAVFRENGKVRVNERRLPIKNLDSLPFPARQLLNIPLYKGQSHRGFSRGFLNITEIMTSRGCPNRCIFCASDVVMGGSVRFRSADSVKREIAQCVERYSFNHFTVSDDTFTLKEDRLYDICDEFARRRISWNCNARVWPLSRKMLSKMAKSGCKGISFGVESGSPRILKLIKKNVTIEQIREAFAWSKEAGIKLVEANIIIGSHPSETKEDISMTQALLSSISPDIVMISVMVPYPGTEVYNIMREKRLLFDGKRWDSFVLFGKKPSWRTENFDPEKLVSLQKKMIRRFYFRPLYILKRLAGIRNPKEMVYWIRGGLDFLINSFKRQK